MSKYTDCPYIVVGSDRNGKAVKLYLALPEGVSQPKETLDFIKRNPERFGKVNSTKKKSRFMRAIRAFVAELRKK